MTDAVTGVTGVTVRHSSKALADTWTRADAAAPADGGVLNVVAGAAYAGGVAGTYAWGGAAGGAAPGLSRDGIAGWTGGALLAVR